MSPRHPSAIPARAGGRSKETTVDWITRTWLRLRERRIRETGQGMVEYALILVLIAVVVIVTLSTVGKSVTNAFSNVSHGLSQ
jgi:pilus assembly protein Flp/PilA